MKILLTGSSGLVGSHIYEYLTYEGHDIQTISSAFNIPLPLGSTTYQDLGNMQASYIDCVIHIGAQIPKKTSGWSLDSFINSNLLNSTKLAEFALRENVSSFMYISSCNLDDYLMDANGMHHSPTYKAETQAYFLSKFLAEEFLRLFFRETHTHLSILRIGTPMSVNSCGSPLIKFITRNEQTSIQLELSADLDEVLNITWLDDLSYAISKLLNRPDQFGKLELVSSSTTIGEILSTVSAITGKVIGVQTQPENDKPRYTKKDVGCLQELIGRPTKSFKDAVASYYSGVSK
jgi:nucleoside-diphosphate-sugar epimerase